MNHKGIVFVDDQMWGKIEDVLSPSAKGVIASSGIPRIYPNGTVTATTISGEAGYQALVLYDIAGNPVLIARGGTEAENEFEKRLMKYVQ